MKYAILMAVLMLAGTTAHGGNSRVNWENAHVHPLAMTPDGTTLLAVNTPDARRAIHAHILDFRARLLPTMPSRCPEFKFEIVGLPSRQACRELLSEPRPA